MKSARGGRDETGPRDAGAQRPAGGARRLDSWPGDQPFSSDPGVDWLLRQVARSLREGRADEALALLSRAAQLERDEELLAEIHLTLGELRREREEHGSALAHFREAAELAPRRADVHYELGLAHARVENSRAAADSLRRAADLAPGDPDVLRALGVALASLGDDAEADRLLRRAQAARPDDVRVLESLAMHHLKMGRFFECGEILRHATELAPDNRLVRRMAKETSYLIERAAEGREAPAPPRPKLAVALEGAAGEVESRVRASLAANGYTEAQQLAARDLWRDYLQARPGLRVREPADHAAAVELLIARLDLVDRASRDVVATRHRADEAAVLRHYHDLVEALDISVFDGRYSTRPHPVEQVGDEAERSGLDPEEVYRALLEDEYREYEETHEQSCSPLPKLTRDEFEDASVEYGALLTREMMGLVLGRRERVRRRELERVLLVT